MSAQSPQARRHVALRAEVLAAHPEVASLAGTAPISVLGAFVVLALHVSVMAVVSRTSAFIVFVVAFFVGQILLHSAGALIHETTHGLVFRRRRPKRAFDLLLEVITTSFGRQLTYQHEHRSSHHRFLGDYGHDYEHEDACRFAARRRLRARSPRLQHVLTGVELALHLLPLGFLFSDALLLPLYRRRSHLATRDRTRHIGASKPAPRVRAQFIAVSCLTLGLWYALFGPLGPLYQIWSLSLFLGKVGITNLGQSIAEHDGEDAVTPTRSTYGWVNYLFFNTGYHHEHHTFPNVPWTRLPKLKALAPELFSAENPRSYFRCWWDHVRADFGPTRTNPVQREDPSVRCAESP